MRRRDEFEARPGNARAHRSDRAAENLGGLGVLQPQHLREDECRSPIGVERFHHRFQGHVPGGVGLDDRTEPAPDDRITDGSIIATATPLLAPGVVDTDTPSNCEQPRFGRALTSISMQRPDGSLVGFLSEIVGITSITEVATHPPHVGLGLGDELLERTPVTGLRFEQELGEPIHGIILSSLEPNREDFRPCVTWASIRQR